MNEGLDLELDTVNYKPLILYMDVKTSLHRGYIFWAGIFSELEYFHWSSQETNLGLMQDLILNMLDRSVSNFLASELL